MFRRTFLTLAPAFIVLPFVAAGQTAPIRLRDLYNKDLSFSDLALESRDQRIDVAGFMAPPLKADSLFFVLTKMPMAVCPFCEPTSPWPDDILAIFCKRTVEVVPFNVPIVVSGLLQLNPMFDPDSGFWAKVSLSDARYDRA